MPRGNSFPNSYFAHNVAGDFTHGNVYWVDSTATNASDGNDGLSKQTPLATLDGAVNKCTANNGDIILCVAGHSETLSADSGVDMDVAGVTVIGLGKGSDRPTFTFATDTAADFKLAAAGCKIQNLLFLCNIASQAMMIEVSGDDCEISHCEFREGSASMLTAVTVGVADGDSDRTWIHDCIFRMDEPGATNVGDAAISIAVDVDNVLIENNMIYGDFDLAGIDVPAGGNASDFLMIRGNYVENTASGQHAVQINALGTMAGGAIVDNTLIADSPATTVAPHTLAISGNSYSGDVALNTAGGREIWVDSGTGASGNDGTKTAPVATIDQGVNLATANSGDIIYVAAGHAESLAADSGVDVDTAGVTIIGLGTGDARPVITLDTATTADFKLAADDCKIENLVFKSGITNLAMMVEVTGDDCEISHCVFSEGTQSMENAISIGTTDGLGDRTWIHHCEFRMDEPGITNVGDAAISIDADVDGVRIEDNWIVGDFDEAGIAVVAGGNASDNLYIARNYIQSTATGIPGISINTLGTMNGGMIVDNRIVADEYATMLAPHTLDCVGNLGNNGVAGTGSVPIPGYGIGTAGSRITVNATGSMASGFGVCDDPVIFTVTGDVMARCWGIVTTAVTSTCNTGTLSLGVADNNTLFIPAITMDATNGAQHDVLANATTTVNGDNLETGSEWAVIANGVDIQAFIATKDMAGGAIDFYCEWIPLSTDGDVT